MAAPDELVIRRLDRFILWLHNNGIERKYVVRSATGLFMVDCFIEHILVPINVASYISLFIVIMIAAMANAVNEYRAKNPRAYNAQQVAFRDSVVSYFRFGFLIFMIAGDLGDFLAEKSFFNFYELFISIPIIGLWWWTLDTFIPETPLGKLVWRTQARGRLEGVRERA